MLYGILPIPAALLVGTFMAISAYQGALLSFGILHFAAGRLTVRPMCVAMITGRPVWSEIAGPAFGVAAWFLLRRRVY
jgi:hypothetical protein